MFLLQIVNNSKINLSNNNKTIPFLTLSNKKHLKFLQNKIILLKQALQEKDKTKLLTSKKKIDVITMKDTLLVYIIHIVLTNTNTLLYVTDIKGNLKHFQSIVSVNITGKNQKTKQPNAILKLLKFFILKSKFLENKPIALHFKNVNKKLLVMLTKILENIFFVKVIRTYNFSLPHNGCRPKKIKRKKHRNTKFK